MKEYNIALLGGDGIGPEVVAQGVKVLDAAGEKFGIKFNYEKALIGGCAYDTTGAPLPDETVALAKSSDAVFLGAVGDWKYDTLPPEVRPEKALLGIRKALNLFANLRPAIVYEELVHSSPLKPELVSGVDIMIIRELTGDVYFGEPKGVGVIDGRKTGYNNMIYTEDEVERIAHVAFKTAMKRKKRLCSVDKANVLDVSRLWREVICRTKPFFTPRRQGPQRSAHAPVCGDLLRPQRGKRDCGPHCQSARAGLSPRAAGHLRDG